MAPTAAIILANDNIVSIHLAQACRLFNPGVDSKTLSPALRRLLHVHGPNGSVRVEGESVTKILGLE